MLRLEQNRGINGHKVTVPNIKLCGVTATALSWIGMTLTLSSLLIFIVAFFTVSWGRSILNTGTVSDGLWRQCRDYSVTSKVSSCGPVDLANSPGYVSATRVFSCVVVLGYVIQSVAVLLYLLLKKFKYDKRMALAIVVSNGTNVIVCLMTVVIYGCGFTSAHSGSRFDHVLSSSYGLAVVSLILNAVSLVVYIVELSKAKFLIPA